MRHEHRERLSRDGYVVVPDALPAAECARYRQLLERDHARWGARTAGATNASTVFAGPEPSRVVYNLHNKDAAYLRLLDHEAAFPLVETLLKEGSYRNAEEVVVQLTTGRSPRPGAPAQQLHIDSNLPGGDFPLVVIALWFIDAFTRDNGATLVVPGSHRFRGYPPDGEPPETAVALTGARGSVLLYNGSLWHGCGANRTAGSRWAIVVTYSRWFLKPVFDLHRNTPASLYEGLSERQRRLLGFDCRPPRDEFTRLSRRSPVPEPPEAYALPG